MKVYYIYESWTCPDGCCSDNLSAIYDLEETEVGGRGRMFENREQLQEYIDEKGKHDWEILDELCEFY
jgi:hypothetical protein